VGGSITYYRSAVYPLFGAALPTYEGARSVPLN